MGLPWSLHMCCSVFSHKFIMLVEDVDCEDNIKEAEDSVVFSFSVTYSISNKDVSTANILLAAITSLYHR